MKSNITERDLISLNFVKQRVEDHLDDPFYFYTLEIGEATLISNADDEAIDGGWIVDVFDYLDLKIYDKDILQRFVDIINEIKNYTDEKN